MLQRAMASDFDNTLYFMFHDVKYRPGDREAIRAFQKSGGLFGVSTGRSLVGLRVSAREDVHFDFYILASGALILDENLQVLSKRTVDISYIKALYERYCQKADTVIQADDTVYTFAEPKFGMQTHIDSFDELQHSDVYGISFYAGSDENARRIAAGIRAEYGDALSPYANTTVVDVVGPGCSKGKAVAVVREKLGIDLMGAIGDSFNDSPMFPYADMSFTFPYAPQAVQNAAGHIVTSIREALDVLSAQGGNQQEHL